MPLLPLSVSIGRRNRRGALPRSLCFGVCCLAIFAAVPSPAAPTKTAVAQNAADDGPVFIDEMIGAKSTRRSGFAPYRSLSATLGSDVFPHALMTEVGGAKASDTQSVLTLKIDGKFERFQATVGRSDNEARNGPAYAYFEVWGDGTCFFRSTAIRSAGSMVTTPAGASVRKTPQEINIAVRGTRTLQLVTRYASTIDQQAPGISRAQGCVWGDPRLMTATARDTPALPAPQKSETPDVSVAPVSEPRIVATAPAVKMPAPVKTKTPTPVKTPTMKSAPPAIDPRRDSVRMAVLLLASGVGSALYADTPQPSPALAYPLKIALMPLRPTLPPVNDRRRRGSESDAPQPTDADLQKLLEANLPTARRGKSSLFTLLDGEGAAQLARVLPTSFMRAVAEPTSGDLSPLASLCRAKQVNAVLIPTLLPGTGTSARGGYRLHLRLFDAVSGSLLSESVQIISAISQK